MPPRSSPPWLCPPRPASIKRVPKKLLVEQGAPTAGDKRQIKDGIEELTWIAALKPSNIGVPAYRDDVREYLEIAVIYRRVAPHRQGRSPDRVDPSRDSVSSGADDNSRQHDQAFACAQTAGLER